MVLLSVVVSAIVLAGLNASPANASTFQAIDLGTLGGTFASANAVNASGQAAGFSLIAGDAEEHDFFWTQAGGMIDLGAPVGQDLVALSDSGQVVGTMYNPGQHAFSWTQAGGLIDLGTLGGTRSAARAVNASGQVVGFSTTTGDTGSRAFLWTQAGGMIDLGTLGGAGSSAVAVNASGQVVGVSALAASGGEHAFSWTQAGGMIDLGTLGGELSRAEAVNDSGQVVGWSSTATGSSLFSWTQAGGMIDLGTIPGGYHGADATALNASGQVVGVIVTAEGTEHAFSWTQAGGMIDLGTLGGTFSRALGVNDSGQVVGFGTTAGDAVDHGFSWTQAGGMIDLGALGGGGSEADAVNASGQVVGSANIAGDAEGHAALWQPVPACGDRVVDLGEQCDDGNTNENDACKNDCTLNVCGDGFVHTGVEQCDDGNLVDGDGCDHTCIVETRSASGTVGAGGTVTTDAGGGATPSQPTQAAVTTPSGGSVTITITAATPSPPSGFQVLTGAVEISAPSATANDPLVLVFTIDASIIPAGQDQNTITILKDGVMVPDCLGSSTASPDPCVSQRTPLAGGDVELTVLTSTASQWAFTVPVATTTTTTTPTTSTTTTPTTSTTLFGCGSSPASGCQPAAPQRAQLQLGQGKLSWKWTSSGTVNLSDFGSPATTTGYVLCLYANAGLKLTAQALPDRTCGTKPCWKALGTKGFKYKDKAGTPNGLTGIKLVAGGAGKARIGVKGKGANLPAPALPLAIPVRAQFKRADTGACWDATYSTATTNTTSEFKAKSD